MEPQASVQAQKGESPSSVPSSMVTVTLEPIMSSTRGERLSPQSAYGAHFNLQSGRQTEGEGFSLTDYLSV